LAAVFVDKILGTYFINGLGFFTLVYCLFIWIPSLAVTVRRLHDVGKSGWLLALLYLLYLLFYLSIVVILAVPSGPSSNAILLFFMSMISLGFSIYFFILLIKGSEPYENKYGPPPQEFLFPESTILR
jgi:uncharacterized membrane protein YhaH (DUF805 family)